MYALIQVLQYYNGVPKLNKTSCISSSAAQFMYPPINAYQADNDETDIQSTDLKSMLK